MELMRRVDAQVVHMRSNRRFSCHSKAWLLITEIITFVNYRDYGPNHVWHMDDYDKLMSIGFCIHTYGCVDAYVEILLIR